MYSEFINADYVTTIGWIGAKDYLTNMTIASRVKSSGIFMLVLVVLDRYIGFLKQFLQLYFQKSFVQCLFQDHLEHLIKNNVFSTLTTSSMFARSSYIIWNTQTNEIRRFGARLKCVVESFGILIKAIPLSRE